MSATAEAIPAAQSIAPSAPMPAANPIAVFESIDGFEAAKKMASTLSGSSLVPEMYRRAVAKERNGNVEWIENPEGPANCLIALELAHRLRVSVLVVMQQVDMIHGRPSLRGTFLIALINASGEFTPVAFECNGLQGDAYGYRMRVRRLSDGFDCAGPWITWAMVNGEGWKGKKGSKWITMPELMFRYRAAAFWSRLYASHITLGLSESNEAEEIRDARAIPAHATEPGRIGDLGAALAARKAQPAEVEPARETNGERFSLQADDEPATSQFPRHAAAITEAKDIDALAEAYEATKGPDSTLTDAERAELVELYNRRETALRG